MNQQFDGAAAEIPDGRTASVEDMRRYGHVIQQFVRDTEARLPHIADTLEHNRIVDVLHTLADAYNQQLRIFREREQQRVQQWQQLLTLLIADAGEAYERPSLEWRPRHGR